MISKRADGICDFCSAPNPYWFFPAKDIAMPLYAAGSRGSWLACEWCSGLIKAERHEALAAHCAKVLSQKHAIRDVAMVQRHVRRVHDLFRKSRGGEGYLYGSNG